MSWWWKNDRLSGHYFPRFPLHNGEEIAPPSPMVSRLIHGYSQVVGLIREQDLFSEMAGIMDRKAKTDRNKQEEACMTDTPETALFTHRSFARTCRPAEIVFITAGASISRKGAMLDWSTDGMCIEISRFIAPGTGITIKLRSTGDAAVDEQRPELYRGTTIWCRPLEIGDGRFCAGVRFSSAVSNTEEIRLFP